MINFKNIFIFLVALVIIWVLLTPAQAQIERYFRKSVSLFRPQIPPEMTVEQGKIIYDFLLEKLQSMGRFDYNPIPLKSGISIEKVFEIAKEYAESQQLERAEKQFELLDEHYKEERITGETLDKIIEGAYVIIPSIENYELDKNVEKVTDKAGNVSWNASIHIKYTLKIEVWNAENRGTAENPLWQPFKEDEDTLATFGRSSKTYYKKVDPKDAARELIDDAIRFSLIPLQLKTVKTLKRFEMFQIKAKVTESDLKKDLVKFDFGKDVGLHIDDPFRVVYFEKSAEGKKRKKNIAFMKIRKLEPNASQAQVLKLYNPQHIKESDLINPGDQVLEIAKMGLNINYRLAYLPYVLKPDSEGIWMQYYDGVDTFYFETDQSAVNGASALLVGWEFDIAPTTGSSELYLYNDYTLLTNFPLFSGLVELGVKKKFYKRQLGGFYGASAGAFLVIGEISEVPETGKGFMYQHPNSGDEIPEGSTIKLRGISVGINFTAGLNYLLNPHSTLTFEGGYRLYPNIKGHLWKIEAKEGNNTWDLDIDEFTGKPASAKISGFWGAIGFIVSI